MQIVKLYYVLETAIRYYGSLPSHAQIDGDVVMVEGGAVNPATPFDLRRWKEPPHLALANLQPDVQALRRFTLKYGILFTHPSDTVRLSDAMRFRDYLRQAWGGSDAILAQMLVDLRAGLNVTPEGLETVPDNLWMLTRLMFLHDRLRARVRICANEDCPARFFLAVRKGQKFCSHPCAVLVNVRRFRQRLGGKRKQLQNQQHTGRGKRGYLQAR